MKFTWSESRVRLRKLLPSCITSFSVRRKDAQGCTADVKDTPPSPEEKPDDLIGPDIDLLGDHYDLRAEIIRQSIESIDSGLSLKSNQSKAGMILFRGSSPLSWLDLSSFQKKHIGSDDGFFESPDDLMTHRSVEAFGSLMNDSLIHPQQHYLPRMVTRSTVSIKSSDFGVPFGINRYSSLPRSDFSSSEKKHDVTYVEEWIRSLDNHTSDDLIGPDIDPVGDHDDLMRMRSTESNDSGVSLQSDGSKVEVIDFKDRVSPSMIMGRPESIHSDVSLKSDWSKAEPFDFKDKVSPRGVITVTVTLAVAGLFISARCVR